MQSPERQPRRIRRAAVAGHRWSARSELPVDPDERGPAFPAPPVHQQWRFVALVAAGGFVGAPARYGVGLLLPHRTGTWPMATLLINVVGAFLLGLLLEALARGGPDVGRRRLARLGLGTGVLGAFTTYSTLAVDTVQLHDAGRTGLATLYLLISVLVGIAAAAAGIAVGAGRAGRPGTSGSAAVGERG